MDKLKVTQNKILKILQFKRKSHINDLPQAVTELFTLNKQVHDYNTRKNERLRADKINTTTYGLRKINHQARLCWESIPNSIKDEVSVNFFLNQN